MSDKPTVCYLSSTKWQTNIATKLISHASIFSTNYHPAIRKKSALAPSVFLKPIWFDQTDHTEDALTLPLQNGVEGGLRRCKIPIIYIQWVRLATSWWKQNSIQQLQSIYIYIYISLIYISIRSWWRPKQSQKTNVTCNLPDRHKTWLLLDNNIVLYLIC